MGVPLISLRGCLAKEKGLKRNFTLRRMVGRSQLIRSSRENGWSIHVHLAKRSLPNPPSLIAVRHISKKKPLKNGSE